MHWWTKPRVVRTHVPKTLGAIACAVVAIGGLASARASDRPATPSVLPRIVTEPPLYPDFQPTITDYVSHCGKEKPIGVTVQLPPATTASVDGQPARGGSFWTQVRRKSGQEFSVVVRWPGAPSTTYYVRCLPADFPTWSAEHLGPTQAEFYLLGPASAALLTPHRPARQYVTLFDSYGVPVWWLSTVSPAFYETLLPDGDVAVTHGEVNGHSGAEQRHLDGTMAGDVDTVGSESDFHELQVRANGNVLLATNVVRRGADLSSWGGPRQADVLDPIVQEITPNGKVAWSWDTMSRIAPSEMNAAFGPQVMGFGSPFDVFHINSIEDAGDTVVISFRHLDAVFAINRVTGAVAWKLGGSLRAESLAVVGDPVMSLGSSFGGQHDARILPDGTLTLHDNGTNRGRQPRVVRYAIDTVTRTATMIEQVTDARTMSSLCCGSARKLPQGNWVISWGFNNLVTEATTAGAPMFSLHLARGLFSYRVEPVMPGELNRPALRAGMDAQYR